MLSLCQNAVRGTRVQPVSEVHGERITAVNTQMPGRDPATLRVVGFAFAIGPPSILLRADRRPPHAPSR